MGGGAGRRLWHYKCTSVQSWYLFVCLGFLIAKQKLLLVNKYKGKFSVVITIAIKPLLCFW